MPKSLLSSAAAAIAGHHKLTLLDSMQFKARALDVEMRAHVFVIGVGTLADVCVAYKWCGLG
jgi:hypothetical protein